MWRRDGRAPGRRSAARGDNEYVLNITYMCLLTICLLNICLFNICQIYVLLNKVEARVC